jgi:serine protease Do
MQHRRVGTYLMVQESAICIIIIHFHNLWSIPRMNRHMISLAVLILACPVFSAHGFSQSKSQGVGAATIQNLSVSLADLALKVRPSVVQVRTVGYGAIEGKAAGLVASQRGTGSGVILDSDGFIVTNAHVVNGAKSIEVILNETNLQSASNSAELLEKRSVAARLIGMDEEIDLAVIKIDRTGLPPLSLVDSDSLRQGQIVLAFGNPMALENSVSMGVISSTERAVEPDDAAVYIQTDAPINPGNSGGALVDAQGRLAGINTFILSQSGGSEGIGFAIPANVVKRVYAELRKEGHIHHGHIGIRALTITSSLAAGLQLPRDWGVIIEDVEPDGPADEAGLQPGDFVTAVDGKTVRDRRQFLIAIDRHAIGDVMQVNILRGSNKVETKVTVQERADDPNRFMEMVMENSNLVARLGILAIDMNKSLLKLIPELRGPALVLVAARVAGLQGSEAGLLPGDLIISLNGKAVSSVEALRELLGKIQSGSPAVLQIQRDDILKYIVLDLF